MKVTMNRMEALSIAKAAESIAPSKATMDELRCVLLECGGDGKLTMAATNNEVALEWRMPAQIQEAGTLLINAKLFVNMLGALGGETVTIQGEDGRLAEITSGACCYTIPILSVSNYPRAETPFPEDTVTVKNIPHMAARTIFAASENESKPTMRCVKLVFTSDGLKAVSYDGSRLAAAKGDSKGEASASLLIPAASLNTATARRRWHGELHRRRHVRCPALSGMRRDPVERPVRKPAYITGGQSRTTTARRSRTLRTRYENLLRQPCPLRRHGAACRAD